MPARHDSTDVSDTGVSMNCMGHLHQTHNICVIFSKARNRSYLDIQ